MPVMLSKVLAAITVLLAVSAEVNAHCAITPMLGVAGTPVRADVQEPSTGSPCGNVDVASTLNNSTRVQATANGTFSVNATDFNAGADGSRSVSAKVDPTAQGKVFSTTVDISRNGDAAPTTVGTDQIIGGLPAGTICSGGAEGNLCLIQFITTAGFGNCVVVAQVNATSPTATGATNGTTTSPAINGTNATITTTNGAPTVSNVSNKCTADAATSTAAKAQPHPKHNHDAADNQIKATYAAKAGTRAARALRYGLEAPGEEVKRDVLNWMRG